MDAIIGKKLGMTRVFDDTGVAVAVTVIEAGPCVVTQVKHEETDGYGAVQLGFGKARRKSLTKPLAGHFEKAGVSPLKKLREFRVSDPSGFEVGQEIKVDVFEPGELVDVTGWSKGRGFQGVIKRHGQSGGRETHGSRSHRVPGSIGQSASPAKVWKGRKLPGRMGGGRVTVRRIAVVDVDSEKNLLLVRGAVPGASNGLVLVRKAHAGGA
jgi:large subunit ribosomal protein L3